MHARRADFFVVPLTVGDCINPFESDDRESSVDDLDTDTGEAATAWIIPMLG